MSSSQPHLLIEPPRVRSFPFAVNLLCHIYPKQYQMQNGISLTHSLAHSRLFPLQRCCSTAGPRRRVINFGGDNGDLTPHLEDSVAFVNSGAKSGGVLIHCTHGTGRSAAVAIATAMKANGDGTPGGGVGDFAEAFRLVKARRPGTDPPMPFQLELDAWEKSMSTQK